MIGIRYIAYGIRLILWDLVDLINVFKLSRYIMR